jgi:hypothetical protein
MEKVETPLIQAEKESETIRRDVSYVLKLLLMKSDLLSLVYLSHSSNPG